MDGRNGCKCWCQELGVVVAAIVGIFFKIIIITFMFFGNTGLHWKKCWVISYWQIQGNMTLDNLSVAMWRIFKVIFNMENLLYTLHKKEYQFTTGVWS